ncbi:DUF58 domain-containing protein [Candidatus Magnetaquicoccus inordinatus]|uniref:DUF58 domain-containing protein n=1 Tax=Candidatus Magnetaquicoccus inordinatus TaxID=2496818 RepID=UPI00102BC9C3|nr:DUF58 domain-containing protein [Candidatus Magnetaquicoccus inordinatus]
MIASPRQSIYPSSAAPSALGPDPVPGGWATRIVSSSLVQLRHPARSLPSTLSYSRSPHSGPIPSPYKGNGIEYAESRPYLAGDEVRHIDWRITARTGKPHTKLFHEERERTSLLWIDLRSSLFFASRGSFKAVIAARAASLLAWHAVAIGHRLGAVICNEQGDQELPPQRHERSVLRLIGLLSHIIPGNTPSAENPLPLLEDSLLRLRRLSKPGSRLSLVSDWHPLSEQMLLQLRHLARHNELLLIQISDPLQYTLPPPGHYPIRDGQHSFMLESTGKAQQERYAEAFYSRLQHLQQFCHNHRIGFVHCSTSEDVLAKLFALFAPSLHSLAQRYG